MLLALLSRLTRRRSFRRRRPHLLPPLLHLPHHLLHRPSRPQNRLIPIPSCRSRKPTDLILLLLLLDRRGHFSPSHHHQKKPSSDHPTPRSHFPKGDDAFVVVVAAAVAFSFAAAAAAAELEAPAAAGECTAAGSAERPPRGSAAGPQLTAAAALEVMIRKTMRRRLIAVRRL